MAKLHHYQIDLQWTGNKGEGTSSYRSYERSHSLRAENKAEILASSDPVFRGDKTKYNPEDLLVASLSGCHMLTYLHLCAINGIVVVGYKDNASGTMEETPDRGGHFLQVTLSPVVTVSDQSMMSKANELHEKASELCFIASSVNFPVHHKASCQVKI